MSIKYNLLHYFNFNVLNAPKSPCLIENSRELSFLEVDHYSNILCADLKAQGIKAKQRVALLAKNSLELTISIIACLKADVVFVPLNYRLATEELRYIVDDSTAAILLVLGDELAELVNDFAGKSNNIPLFRLDNLLTEQSINHYQRQPLNTAKSRDEAICQMYTSGTTGHPKGVLSGHQQLIDIVFVNLLMSPRLNSGNFSLLLMPLFHAVGLAQFFINLTAGLSTVMMADFHPVEVVKAIEKYKISDTIFVPTMIEAILTVLQASPDSDVTSLKRIVYGASPISKDLLKRSMKAFNAEFIQGYGMTELCGGVVFLTADDHRRAINGEEHILQSCGRPGPGIEVRILDPEKNILPINSTGEIAIRSNTLMHGYWQLTDKTSEVIMDGWYLTGDAGYIDEDGFVYIRDRLKDMVITGGENVYPIEIEKVLLSHPNISDVAVIGIPDEKYGESLLAICVFSQINTNSISVDDIIEFCRPLLGGYKIPRQYKFVDSLPRNASGKILKRELRTPYWLNN